MTCLLFLQKIPIWLIFKVQFGVPNILICMWYFWKRNLWIFEICFASILIPARHLNHIWICMIFTIFNCVFGHFQCRSWAMNEILGTIDFIFSKHTHTKFSPLKNIAFISHLSQIYHTIYDFSSKLTNTCCGYIFMSERHYLNIYTRWVENQKNIYTIYIRHFYVSYAHDSMCVG